MAALRIVSVPYAGRNWNAAFTVEGGEVSVGSAYGSSRAEFGRRKPEVVAQKLLLEIVTAYCRR